MGKQGTKFVNYSQYFFVCVVGIQFLLLLFTCFTAWPEMILWPYLILKGWLPYRDIAIAHTPLLLLDLTIFYKLFGLGVTQLKIFTWLYILATDLVFYWVVKKLLSGVKALVSLVMFVFLSLGFQINGLWFDLGLVLPAILIFYFLKTKKYFWVGVIWTVAFFTKQTAVLFLPAIGVWFFVSQRKNFKSFWPEAEKIILTFLISALAVFLPLAALKILPSFLTWAFQFGVYYLPRAVGQISLPTLKQLLGVASQFLIVFPYLWLFKKKSDLTLLSFVLFLCLGAYPRWELFHFLPALPFLAIVAAEVLVRGAQIKSNLVKLMVGVWLAICLTFLARYVSRNLTTEVRFFEPSVQKLAGDIKKEVGTKEIFIINYWDSLYAFSGTLPAVKPWIPYMPWYLEYGNLKKEVVNQVKIARPAAIVVGKFTTQGPGAYKLPDLMEYVNRYYQLEETVGSAQLYLKK